MKLQASENNLQNSLKTQFSSAVAQAEDAKKAVQQKAMRLQETAAKRMELVGSLRRARMQESVNKAVESISATMGDDAVSAPEGRKEDRAAQDQRNGESRVPRVTPGDAEMELLEAVSVAQADAKYAELRKELGIPS